MMSKHSLAEFIDVSLKLTHAPLRTEKMDIKHQTSRSLELSSILRELFIGR